MREQLVRSLWEALLASPMTAMPVPLCYELKLWHACAQVELRHLHFAGASLRLTRAMDEFRAKHKAAGDTAGGRPRGRGGNASLDMRQMRSLVQQLPQYRCVPFPPVLPSVTCGHTHRCPALLASEGSRRERCRKAGGGAGDHHQLHPQLFLHLSRLLPSEASKAAGVRVPTGDRGLHRGEGNAPVLRQRLDQAAHAAHVKRGAAPRGPPRLPFLPTPPPPLCFAVNSSMARATAGRARECRCRSSTCAHPRVQG